MINFIVDLEKIIFFWREINFEFKYWKSKETEKKKVTRKRSFLYKQKPVHVPVRDTMFNYSAHSL